MSNPELDRHVLKNIRSKWMKIVSTSHRKRIFDDVDDILKIIDIYSETTDTEIPYDIESKTDEKAQKIIKWCKIMMEDHHDYIVIDVLNDTVHTFFQRPSINSGHLTKEFFKFATGNSKIIPEFGKWVLSEYTDGPHSYPVSPDGTPEIIEKNKHFRRYNNHHRNTLPEYLEFQVALQKARQKYSEDLLVFDKNNKNMEKLGNNPFADLLYKDEEIYVFSPRTTLKRKMRNSIHSAIKTYLETGEWNDDTTYVEY